MPRPFFDVHITWKDSFGSFGLAHPCQHGLQIDGSAGFHYISPYRCVECSEPSAQALDPALLPMRRATFADGKERFVNRPIMTSNTRGPCREEVETSDLWSLEAWDDGMMG